MWMEDSREERTLQQQLDNMERAVLVRIVQRRAPVVGVAIVDACTIPAMTSAVPRASDSHRQRKWRRWRRRLDCATGLDSRAGRALRAFVTERWEKRI
jgi:hypothetical protein